MIGGKDGKRRSILKHSLILRDIYEYSDSLRKFEKIVWILERQTKVNLPYSDLFSTLHFYHTFYKDNKPF